MKGKQKTHQTQVMISMKVTNEDMIDPGTAAPEPLQLNLSSFPTINEEMPLINRQEL
jgi:hypothetical protein